MAPPVDDGPAAPGAASVGRLHLRLGIGACVGAAALIGFAIPGFVSSPSNVGDMVLSPTFWPYVLAGLTGLVGLGLVASAFGAGARAAIADEGAEPPDPRGAVLRVAGMAGIMVLTMIALPRLGMVWTAMLAFGATAALLRTRHPLAALLCAVAVPLVLYAFFAHVAGVAVPQGEILRLP